MTRQLAGLVYIAIAATLALACESSAIEPIAAIPTPTSSPLPTRSVAPTASPTPQSTLGLPAGPTGPIENATAAYVVDGDTIHVLINGVEYRLRYIGIDAPESVDPDKPVEWMGKQASDANQRLVDGRQVVLEKDVSDTDHYGRLLRYVWLHDANGWLMINAELVRLGFAEAYTYPPDVKYAGLFVALEQSAREAGLGLWGQPPDTSMPTIQPH